METKSKKSLRLEKERILTRLKEIEEDRNYVIEHVNKHFEQAQAAAGSLLNESSRSKFLRKHHNVTQTLNDCWREIFRVKSHLVDGKEEDEESSSSSSDESVGSVVSEFSVSTVSGSSHLLELSYLSAASCDMSPMAEEGLTGDKTPRNDPLHFQVSCRKTFGKPIPEEENDCSGSGCSGDTCVAQDHDALSSLNRGLPLSPCGDGLKNTPLDSQTMPPSTFPNVNCSEFVSSTHLHGPTINENYAAVDTSSPKSNYADSDGALHDTNGWAAWQNSLKKYSSASNLELIIPESHLNSSESVDNASLSEQSLPSDRTIIGTTETVTEIATVIEPALTVSHQSASDHVVPGIQKDSDLAITRVENNVPVPSHLLPSPAILNKRLIAYESSENSTCSSSSLDVTTNRVHSHTTSAESLVSVAGDISIENITFCEGALIEGIVTALTSPSDVWIQIQNENFGMLLEEMSAFCEGSKSEEVGKELTEGHFCCAKCTNDDSWNRAVVHKVRYTPAETNASGAPKFVVDSVDVRYVDYGNSETLGLDRLKRPRPKFFKLPAQAVCCLLGKLRPYSTKYEEWNMEMTNQLRELVFGKEVQAKVLKNWPGSATIVLLSIPDENIEDVEDLVLRKLSQIKTPTKEPRSKKLSADSVEVSSSTEQDNGKSAAKAAAKRMTDDAGSSYTTTNEKTDEILRENFTWGASIEKLCPEASDGFFLMVSHINSPSSFYGQVMPEASCYEELQTEVNDTYKKATDLKAPISSVVTVNTCWGTKYSDDNWYRVRVLIESKKADSQLRRRRRIAVNPPEDKVFVEYIDYGNRDWVSIEDLRPLRKEHCKQPSLAVHFRLAHVFPVQMTPEQGHIAPCEWQWSKESLIGFNDIMGFNEDTLFLARIVEDDEELSHFGVCERSEHEPLTVVLWDGTSYSTSHIVNRELVNKGLAMSLKYGVESDEGQNAENESSTLINELEDSNTTDASAKRCADSMSNNKSRSDILEEQNGTESVEHAPVQELMNWDPMESDYTSERNSYELDVDDAGVAAIGYKFQDEKNVCRYFSKGYTCHKGNTCPFKHIDMRYRTETTDTVPFFIGTCELLLPSANKCVYAEVTAIFNPGHFYVVLPYGSKDAVAVKEQGKPKIKNSENLSVFMDALEKHYSKQRQKPNPNIIPSVGEMVVARFSADNSWYRAKVVDVPSEDGQVMVFFVDFGNTDWVFQSDIRSLEAEFNHMPHQAIECFMSDIEPIRRSERLSWSVDSRKWFEEMVEAKELVLHVITSDQMALYVELYDTTEEEHININHKLAELGYAQVIKTPSLLKGKLKTKREAKSHDIIKVPG